MPTDQQTRGASQTGLVKQVKACLHSGEYSRAVDLLREMAVEFPNETELPELENLAQEGLKRNAEAQRLITESQELFAQRKSTEAIQLLRQAYELDKKNGLARAILANALVEQAHSIVETDWLEAEKLTNQALGLNAVHPTARTILSLIVERKKNSTIDDWVSRAHKLQSTGDLFAALAWVAEGLAVHPNDPKLLQIQDSIQRDQSARRRQSRRRDMEDLRRIALEIDGAADVAAKQALAERVQGMAAKYWTDGEILSIANGLLHRLGLVPQTNSTGNAAASPHGKAAAVIFHVPRTSASKPASADLKQTAHTPIDQNQAAQNKIEQSKVSPSPVPVANISAANVPAASVPRNAELPSQAQSSKVQPSKAPPSKAARGTASTALARQEKARVPTSEPQSPSPAASVTIAEPATTAAKATSQSSQAKRPASSNLTSQILVSAAVAIVAIAATFFFVRRHYAPPIVNVSAEAPSVSPATTSVQSVSSNVSVSNAAAPAVAPSAPATPEATSIKLSSLKPPVPGLPLSSTGAGKGTLDDQSWIDQRAKDQPLRQRIAIHDGEQPKIISNLQPQPQPQPQPRLASLTIQGGAPGTGVFIDQILVGTVQADRTLSVSTVNPGDHNVELRKERFKPRQFKEHFVAGGTISLAAADAALEAVAEELKNGELKITFAPADAKVAVVNGDLLTTVSSGVPLNLAAGTYTLTARTADRFTRSSTLEVVAGQSRTLNLSLAPNGMSKWEDPGTWKQEGDSFIRKGGDFVLYGVVPVSGTLIFSAMPAKGHLLQWVLNYTDPRNYILFQMDDNNFYRTVIRNGKKSDEIIVPDKNEKRAFRTFHIRVSSTEIVHQIKQGDSWIVLDRWTQPGANLSLGKFGFYVPGNDQIAVSSFAHYADLNIR